MFTFITATVSALSVDLLTTSKYGYWFRDMKRLKENGWSERYKVLNNTFYIASERILKRSLRYKPDPMVDPIEVLIDAKTSVPDPKYVYKLVGRNYLNRHKMIVTKLPSEKPGYTIYSYKCTMNCQFKLPNVTDVASVKSRNFLEPGTYKKEKIVDGWKVRVVSRPSSP